MSNSNTPVTGMPGKSNFVVAAFMTLLSNGFQAALSAATAITDKQDQGKALRALTYGSRVGSSVQGVHTPEKALQMLQRCVTTGQKADKIVDGDIEVYTFQIAQPYREKVFTCHMLVGDFFEGNAADRANIGIALAHCSETGQNYARLQAPAVGAKITDRVTVLMRGSEFVGWYAGRYLTDYTVNNVAALCNTNGQFDISHLPIQVGMNFEEMGRAARRHKNTKRHPQNNNAQRRPGGTTSIGAVLTQAQQQHDAAANAEAASSEAPSEPVSAPATESAPAATA